MSLATTLRQPVRIIGKNLRDLAILLGIGPTLDCHNRRVLEESVFPYIVQQQQWNQLLFVGCHWYTWHYKRFFASKEYWTLEIDPGRARYGASRHIIDSVTNVEKHFAANSLDLIMIIGVIGWGLDCPQGIEVALEACRTVLRPGGLLVLGCDEVPEHLPIDLTHSSCLSKMTPFVFPPLAASRFRCEGDLKHTLTFFTKPGEQ